ncbi:PIG-L deacetylase family protein [Streptomyces sp. NPDC001221]
MTEPHEPMPKDWQRAPCVAAHPDDPEYGPASAVARWTAQGKCLACTLMSRGEAGSATMDPQATAAMRSGEQVRAAAAVGVRDVDFLDHPDGTIEYGLPLRRDLARSIRRYRPDVLGTVNFYER